MGKQVRPVVSSIQGINLELAPLKEACGLSFDEDQRRQLEAALMMFEAQAWDESPVPTKDVKRALEKIKNGARKLVAVLTPYVRGDNGPEHDAFKAAYPDPDYGFAPEPGALLAFLEELCAQAEAAQAVQEPRAKNEKGGRPKDYPIRFFIRAVHQVFAAAGGQGRGSYKWEGSKGHGPFHALMQALLEQSRVNTVIMGRTLDLSVKEIDVDGNHVIQALGAPQNP